MGIGGGTGSACGTFSMATLCRLRRAPHHKDMSLTQLIMKKVTTIAATPNSNSEGVHITSMPFSPSVTAIEVEGDILHITVIGLGSS